MAYAKAMYISTGNRMTGTSRWLVTALVLLFALLFKVEGQEPVYFGQHPLNRMVYNPAWAGDRDIPGFSLLSRQQWVSWEGSPSANLLNFHTRLPDKNVGLGISLEYERMGPVQYSGLKGMYAYTLQVGESGTLNLGLQGELRLLQVKIAQLKLVDQGDPLYGEDPGMKFQPNVGVGAAYIRGNFRAGISLPRMLNSALTPYRGETSQWSSSSRVLYLDLGWNQRINENISLDPSLLLAFSAGRSPLIELSGLVHLGEKISLGAMYRFDQTIGGMIRYKHVNRYVFGYSYDLALGKLLNNVGTHELFLGYNLPFNRIKTLSPRNF
jgi:type IX secretion system PorP/SprF family membrane protein